MHICHGDSFLGLKSSKSSSLSSALSTDEPQPISSGKKVSISAYFGQYAYDKKNLSSFMLNRFLSMSLNLFFLFTSALQILQSHTFFGSTIILFQKWVLFCFLRVTNNRNRTVVKLKNYFLYYRYLY